MANDRWTAHPTATTKALPLCSSPIEQDLGEINPLIPILCCTQCPLSFLLRKFSCNTQKGKSTLCSYLPCSLCCCFREIWSHCAKIFMNSLDFSCHKKSMPSHRWTAHPTTTTTKASDELFAGPVLCTAFLVLSARCTHQEIWDFILSSANVAFSSKM